MKDSDFLDLANRVIDGVGTEHDRVALDAVLRDSTQRRLEFDQLSAVSSILDAVRPVEAPDGLRDRILAQIPAPSAARGRPSALSTALASLRELVGSKPMVGLSYAIAAGLIVGVVLSLAVPRTDMPDPNVFGTFGAAAEGARETVRADGLRAETVLVRTGETVEFFLVAEADRPVELRLETEQAVAWTGVTTDVESGLSGVEITTSGISIAGVTTGRYRIQGKRDGSISARVQFRSSAGDDLASVALTAE